MQFETSRVLEREFPKRAELPVHETFLEFFRKRQMLVLIGVIALVFLVATGLHNFIETRAAKAASDVPAIPLTEVSDLANREGQQGELPLPNLPFQFDGQAKTLRTFVMEPGAVAPPPPPPDPNAAAATPAAAPPGAAGASGVRSNQPAPRPMIPFAPQPAPVGTTTTTRP